MGSPPRSGQLGGAKEPDPQRSECPGEEFCSPAGNAHHQTGKDRPGLRGGAWDGPPHSGRSCGLQPTPRPQPSAEPWLPACSASAPGGSGLPGRHAVVPNGPAAPRTAGRYAASGQSLGGTRPLWACRLAPQPSLWCWVCHGQGSHPIRMGPRPSLRSPMATSPQAGQHCPLSARPKLPLAALSTEHLSCSKGPTPWAALQEAP